MSGNGLTQIAKCQGDNFECNRFLPKGAKSVIDEDRVCHL